MKTTLSRPIVRFGVLIIAVVSIFTQMVGCDLGRIMEKKPEIKVTAGKETTAENGKVVPFQLQVQGPVKLTLSLLGIKDGVFQVSKVTQLTIPDKWRSTVTYIRKITDDKVMLDLRLSNLEQLQNSYFYGSLPGTFQSLSIKSEDFFKHISSMEADDTLTLDEKHRQTILFQQQFVPLTADDSAPKYVQNCQSLPMEQFTERGAILLCLSFSVDEPF